VLIADIGRAQSTFIRRIIRRTVQHNLRLLYASSDVAPSFSASSYFPQQRMSKTKLALICINPMRQRPSVWAEQDIATKTKYFAILPLHEDPCGSLSAIVVPRLMRIPDAAKYRSATTWQVETLLREKVIPSFVLGKRRVVDRLELDRYVERRNALARTETLGTTHG